jgi:hypothetical protein
LLSETIIYKTTSQVCWNSRCGRELVEYIDTTLGESKYFQRSNGRDHFIPMSFFMFYRVRGKRHYLPNLKKLNEMSFEIEKNNNPDRLSFPSLYMGQPCDQVKNKTRDLAFIATLESGRAKSNNNINFRSRRMICDLLHGPNKAELPSTKKNYTMPVCGKGAQCPALAEARFGFHLGGDSPGANRLIDTLLSGTVPIFTLESQRAVLPHWFDWDELSYFANASAPEEYFLADVDRILADQEGYKKRLHNVLSHRYLFDWKGCGPFDTYMYAPGLLVPRDSSELNNTQCTSTGTHATSTKRRRLNGFDKCFFYLTKINFGCAS